MGKSPQPPEPALPVSNKTSAWAWGSSPNANSLSFSKETKPPTNLRKKRRRSAFCGASISFEDGVGIPRSIQLSQKPADQSTESEAIQEMNKDVRTSPPRNTLSTPRKSLWARGRTLSASSPARGYLSNIGKILSNEVKPPSHSQRPSALGNMSFKDGVSVLIQPLVESEISFGSITEAYAPKTANPIADASNLKSFSTTPITNDAVPSSSTLALSSTELSSKLKTPSAFPPSTSTHAVFDAKLLGQQPSNAKFEYAGSTSHFMTAMVDPPLSPSSHPMSTPRRDENTNPALAETLTPLPSPGLSMLQSPSRLRPLLLPLKLQLGAPSDLNSDASALPPPLTQRRRRPRPRPLKLRPEPPSDLNSDAPALPPQLRPLKLRLHPPLRPLKLRPEPPSDLNSDAPAPSPPSPLQPPSDLNFDAPALASLPLSDSNPKAPTLAERTVHGDISFEPFPRSSPLCLDGQISDRSEYVVASGGYADVWTGSLGNKFVAIKVMRPFSGCGSHIEISKVVKRSWREYLAWSRLDHPNILDCLGFSYDFSPQNGQPSLVSPWMTNGTAMDYIKKRPNLDRVEIVVGIAQGLKYLHNMKPTIVHGDLRAGNVLISDRGTACLADFGLSRLISETRGMTTSSEVAGSVRWMAPELLDESGLSVQSDVWAYGMTVLEIFTGTRPYSETTLEASALLKIVKGELPARPKDVPVVTDDVWNLCQKCWQILPEKRSSINDVLAEIEGVRGGDKPP